MKPLGPPPQVNVFNRIWQTWLNLLYEKVKNGSITLGTPIATTSGTSIDITGIPPGTKRIVVMISGVSTNGTSLLGIQMGASGGIETTGYSGSVGNRASEIFYSSSLAITNGMIISTPIHGNLILTLVDGTTWTSMGIISFSSANAPSSSSGSKTLSAELTQLRVVTGNGTDIFNAGSINIQYES